MSPQLRTLNAMEAHTNLNTFATIVSILEGGHVYGPAAKSARRTAKKIIALCQAEIQKQLAAMDQATGRTHSVRVPRIDPKETP